MKLFIAAALAATALTSVAAPAMAQPYGPPPPPAGDWHGPGPGAPGGPGFQGPGAPGAWGLDRRLDWMQQRISRGRDDGSLDPREARRAERTLNSIRDEARRDRAYDGHLREGDRMRLQARLDGLNDQLHWLRQNNDRRPW